MSPSLDLNVASGTTEPRYNETPPFHPAARFPELPFSDVSSSPNPAYALLRQLWLDLGLDGAHAVTSAWNPFGDFIQPGDTVLLKPNFVTSRNISGDDLFAVVTHPSVLRSLVDYTYLALKGRGRIVIADAPDMGCEWNVLMAAQHLDTIQKYYRERFNFSVEVYDLRNFAMRDPHQPAYHSNRFALTGDPAGHTFINLGQRSAFHELPSANYYGADYDRAETIRHHHGDIHEYCIANTFLAADVVISVPKMKVHKKVGVTLNIKGLVGLNTNKNCLIHYRIGTPLSHGDQLPDGRPVADQIHIRVQRWLNDHALARRSPTGEAIYAIFRSIYRNCIKPFRALSHDTLALDGGNWYGNDSAWRMATDLAKIFYFADRHGNLKSSRQRRMFCVVDGIIAGEKEGPLAPSSKACGCLVAGVNPLAVDIVTSRLMGFDFRLIKQFSILNDSHWDFGFSDPLSLDINMNGRAVPALDYFSSEWISPITAFIPHPGWRGQIELEPSGRIS